MKGWKHLLIEAVGCEPKALSNVSDIYDFLRGLPSKIGMERLGEPIVYMVTPNIHEHTGATGTQIITTSHIAIHTFDKGNGEQTKPFFVFDLFSCKEYDERIVIAELNRMFCPETMKSKIVYREI